jgi:uncharacterized protein
VSVVETTLAGETVQLHAERALFWPRHRLLAIADLHLGKGQAFRRGGVALPVGGTALDLARIDRLIDAFEPSTMLVLGDLLHGAVESDAPWLAQWVAWRERHAEVRVQVIAGNHDRALRAEQLRIENVGVRLAMAPFLFTHDAVPADDRALHTIGGHMHPILRVKGIGVSSRLPAFWFGARHSVLPAFTAFSGGSEVVAQPGDRLWVCAGEAVVEMPARAFAGIR